MISRDCQKNDWNNHKKMCLKFKSMEESRIKTNLINWISSKGNVVKVEQRGEKGRCLIATRDIGKGDLIISSESYAVVKENDNDEETTSYFDDIEYDKYITASNKIFSIEWEELPKYIYLIL